MKDFVKDFITPEESATLRGLLGGESYWRRDIKDLDPSSTAYRVVDRLKDHFDYTLNEKSYICVEHKGTGHDWHKDTGDRDHMLWCTYGCSIMLSRDYEYTGGLFHYKDVEIQPEFCGLLWHDSKTMHKVDPHQGLRIVCLIFI
jgi:hypothetical protein